MFSRLCSMSTLICMYIKAYKYICVLTIAHHFGESYGSTLPDMNLGFHSVPMWLETKWSNNLSEFDSLTYVRGIFPNAVPCSPSTQELQVPENSLRREILQRDNFSKLQCDTPSNVTISVTSGIDTACYRRRKKHWDSCNKDGITLEWRGDTV